jgi:hypothetical protein
MSATKLCAGINIITYYAPTLFQDSLGMSQERSLFLGCFLQLFYVLASFLTVKFTFLSKLHQLTSSISGGQ